jgi:hypothetical protein
MPRTLARLIVIVLLIGGGTFPVSPLLAQQKPPVLKQAPLAFVATLKSVQAGPVAKSFPPIYSFTLTFADAEPPLRGTLPDPLVFAHRVRAVDPPVLEEGAKYLVTAGGTDRPLIVELLPATKENIRAAEESFSLPIGWSKQEGKIVSPWAQRGEHAWPKDAQLTADLRCDKTGRPALMAGAGITIKVDQVKPENLQEFKNPFGDGLFTVTVTNTGKKAATVPALVKDGDEIRWHDSLVIICRDKALLLPSNAPLKSPTAVELAPGESVSTTIDTLLLSDEVMWPRGGSRVHFTFALGEIAAENFFYYFSNLHDGIRAEHQKAFAAEK